jgi:hypothetical protein
MVTFTNQILMQQNQQLKEKQSLDVLHPEQKNMMLKNLWAHRESTYSSSRADYSSQLELLRAFHSNNKGKKPTKTMYPRFKDADTKTQYQVSMKPTHVFYDS